MAEIFGTVTAVIGTVDVLYNKYKDLRDRIEKVSRNPQLAEEVDIILERLSSQLKPIAKICENNDVKFSDDFLETFQSCIKRIEEVTSRAQKELEETQKKLESRSFRFRKAETTCALLSQLLSSAKEADHDIFAMTRCFANAELIARNNPAGQPKDEFTPSFDVETNPSYVLLDYGSEADMELKKDEISHLTVEGKLKHAVLRKNECVRVGAVGSRTGSSVGMAGMGGVGKSCALRGLASDEMVQERFAGGVYLIVLGKDVKEADIVREIGLMLERSGGAEAAKAVLSESTMKGAVVKAKKWFSSKCILLLIDDIWERGGGGIDALGQLEEIVDRKCGSGVAFTTREWRVASRGEMIHFAARDDRTAREMLVKAAGGEGEVEGEFEGDTEEEFERVVDEVLQFCGGLPMALSVVGRAIRLRHSVSNGCMVDAWKEQVVMLQKYRGTILEDRDASYMYANLSKAFGTSLSMLDEMMKERAGYSLSLTFEAMYRGLIVMRRQGWISVRVLGVLWGIDEVKATEVIQRFAEMSLAERKDVRIQGERRAGITLHDLQVDFVQKECEENGEERKWPRRLLEGWIGEEKGGSSECEDVCRSWWKDEIFREEEIRDNVCRLLRDAGLENELQNVLMSASWIGKRLREGEILELEEDFGMLLRKMEKNEERSNERGGEVWSLKMIVGAARLSAPFVKRNGREVWFQMYGRLVDHRKESIVIEKFLKGIGEVAERPWIKPLSGCLPGPGGALYRTLLCQGYVKSIWVSDNGERVVACCGTVEGEMGLFMFQDGLLEKEIWPGMKTGNTRGDEGRSMSEISAVCLRLDGERAVTGHLDGSVQVWDAKSGKAVGEPFRGHSDSVNCMAWSGDGRRVVSGSRDGTVRVWDVESGQAVGEPFRGHSGWVNCVAWSGDGRRVVSGSDDVRIWDVESGEAVGEPFRGDSDWVRCVAWSGDGKRLASGSDNGRVRMWDLESGEAKSKDFRGHRGRVRCVAWLGDGRCVASGSEDKTVRVWDVQSGKVVGEPFRGHSEWVECVAWSEDGRQVASGSRDKTVRIWDVENGKAVAESLFARRDRVRVAGWLGGGWLSNGRSDYARNVAWSEDGRRVASFSNDFTVRVWDVESGEAVGGPLRGHIQRVRCVAWSSDGRRVASGSEDRTVRVWDVENGEAVAEPFRGHSHRVRCVAWSSDDRRVASGADDRTVRVWDVESGVCVKVHEEEEGADEDRCNVLADDEVLHEERGRCELLTKIRCTSSGLVYDGDEGEMLVASFEGRAIPQLSAKCEKFAVQFNDTLCFMELVE